MQGQATITVPDLRPAGPRLVESVDLLFPVLPPVLDGIGDYTARLASALAGHADVRILTGPGADFDSVDGAGVEAGFTSQGPRMVSDVADMVSSRRPDLFVLQYNPFSYGRYAVNPFLAGTLKAVRNASPATRIALMIHECYTPPLTPRQAVLHVLQKRQLRACVRNADLLFLSTESWKDYLPAARKPIIHLPVGSNIDGPARAVPPSSGAFGLPKEATVIGLFGTVHASRLTHYVRRALREVRDAGRPVRLLYVGSQEERVAAELGDERDLLVSAGPLPADRVRDAFAAMDVYVCPFIDGVSTRRGSFMAGLQQGVPTVTTTGYHTDAVLREAAGRAFLAAEAEDEAAFVEGVLRLVADSGERRRVAAAGRDLYHRQFDWPVTARRLLEAASTLRGEGRS
jgi:glycosyltransferase involved in cell wall biosynthesis